MKDLLSYIIENITGNSEFDIIVSESETGMVDFTIKIDKDHIGIIIGKEGRTIKSIRNLLKVRAVIENKAVNINIEEK